jgi:hypothetical protein
VIYWEGKPSFFNEMNEYWEVVLRWSGKVIAHCGDECDARMLCELSPKERIYRKAKFILDQVIDVTSTQINNFLDSKVYLQQKKNYLP